MSVKKTLKFSELFVISFFLILMVSMVLISRLSSAKAKSFLSDFRPTKLVQVEISGEVLKPGSFEVEVGSSVGEVIKKARPKRFADLCGLDKDQIVCEKTVLEIPKLKEIRVYVVGEVAQPYEFLVEPGTRVCQLKSKISLSENGDPAPLSSRRILADCEKITILKRK